MSLTTTILLDRGLFVVMRLLVEFSWKLFGWELNGILVRFGWFIFGLLIVRFLFFRSFWIFGIILGSLDDFINLPLRLCLAGNDGGFLRFKYVVLYDITFDRY